MSNLESNVRPSADWEGKRVLVTGGAGFLGSNLCHALSKARARVAAVDSLLPGGGGNLANLDGAEVALRRGNIDDMDLASLLDGTQTIFNLAGGSSHVGGQEDPLTDVENNIHAQVRLIEVVRQRAPEAVIVHASTRQLYGRPQSLPVTEEHPVVPPDANSISKFAGEQYWMLEHRLRGCRVVSLRLTNSYGPRMRIRDSRQNFLGHWIGQILRQQPFELWGGAQLRDLTFVDDVTEAFLTAAVTPECYGKVFNIGGAGPASLREIADKVVEISGDGARYTMGDLPDERSRIDIGSYFADDSAFKAATGWSSTTDFADGFARTLDWFRRNRSAYL